MKTFNNLGELAQAKLITGTPVKVLNPVLIEGLVESNGEGLSLPSGNVFVGKFNDQEVITARKTNLLDDAFAGRISAQINRYNKNSSGEWVQSESGTTSTVLYNGQLWWPVSEVPYVTNGYAITSWSISSGNEDVLELTTTTGSTLQFSKFSGLIDGAVGNSIEIPEISFLSGGTILRKTQTIEGPDGEWYIWGGSLPLVIPPGSGVGSVGKSGFSLVSGTSPLRPSLEILANSAGLTLNSTSFEQGATISSSTEALIQFKTGKLYKWGGTLPKVVGKNSVPQLSGGINGTGWVEVDSVVSSSQYLTPSALTKAVDLRTGYLVSVISLGNAVFKISPPGTEVLSGDISISDGRVAVLQPSDDGSYNIEWFGAVQDPTNAGPDQTAIFELGAARAGVEKSSINVFGAFRISGTTTSSTTWNIGPRAKIFGRPGVSPSYDFDTSGLLGQVISLNGVNPYGTMYVGDPTYYMQKITNKSDTDASVSGANVKGSPGGTFTSYTSGSDFNPSRQSSIGVTARVVVDSDKGITGWGSYIEHYKMPGAVGNSFGTETTCFNIGGVVASNPYAQPGLDTGVTIGHWLSSGGIFGSPDSVYGKYEGTNDATAAIGIIGKGGCKYNKGVIVYANSISSGEVISMPSEYKFSWWGGLAGFRQSVAYIKASNPDFDRKGQVKIGCFSEDKAKFRELIISPDQVSPDENNVVILGNALNRFKSLYLQNSPDVVSDMTKKTSIRGLTKDELNAGLDLSRNVQMFKWISEVDDKGEEDSYYHSSVMAQEAWQILIDNGLEPSNYGFVSNDDSGWSILPTELSMLMCAAMVRRQDDLEARLSKLEE